MKLYRDQISQNRCKDAAGLFERKSSTALGVFVLMPDGPMRKIFVG